MKLLCGVLPLSLSVSYAGLPDDLLTGGLPDGISFQVGTIDLATWPSHKPKKFFKCLSAARLPAHQPNCPPVSTPSCLTLGYSPKTYLQIYGYLPGSINGKVDLKRLDVTGSEESSSMLGNPSSALERPTNLATKSVPESVALSTRIWRRNLVPESGTKICYQILAPDSGARFWHQHY